MLPVLGATLLVALLLSVVVDATRVFLAQRALSALADGAALSAADALDEAAFYSRAGSRADSGPDSGPGSGRSAALGQGGPLPLDAAAAQEAGARHLAEAGAQARFASFTAVTQLGADGTTVSVTCSAVVRLPVLTAVNAAYADGYPVAVTASARTPLAR